MYHVQHQVPISILSFYFQTSALVPKSLFLGAIKQSDEVKENANSV